jgi:hypothetical protein
MQQTAGGALLSLTSGLVGYAVKPCQASDRQCSAHQDDPGLSRAARPARPPTGYRGAWGLQLAETQPRADASPDRDSAP